MTRSGGGKEKAVERKGRSHSVRTWCQRTAEQGSRMLMNSES